MPPTKKSKRSAGKLPDPEVLKKLFELGMKAANKKARNEPELQVPEEKKE